jgi:23S rRNA pseudouridine1911/1915/1917 synthase
MVTRKAGGSGDDDPERPAKIFALGPADRGMRLDRFVAEALGIGRKAARELCDAGLVRVDGRAGAKGDFLREASAVEVREPASESPVAEPELELDVRLERPELVVVSKPAGMPTAPLAPGERGTLAGALVARYPEMRSLGYRVREPGLVHRLDTLTSGLVVAARNKESFEVLVNGLRRGLLEKRYLAVVSGLGLEESGTIDLPLTPNAGPRGGVGVPATATEYARDSITHFRVLSRGAGLALLEIDASPAFRHQIRAHLSAIGHPIVGDTPYGGAPHPLLSGRHALHASHVAWAGDAVPSFEVTDPAPAEFLALLAAGGAAPDS